MLYISSDTAGVVRRYPYTKASLISRMATTGIMADTTPDTDMFTKPFQLTKTMRRDVYPAVDPTSPGLKADGKVVLITGAGGGIGYVRIDSHLSVR